VSTSNPARTAEGGEPVDGAEAPDWVRGLPKAEVHVHLEGSLPPDLVAAAAREMGRELPELAFSDLAGFLAYLDASCAVITTADQVATAGYAVAQRAAAAGVRYVDLIWNPTHWPAWRERLPAFVDAIDSGFRSAASDGLPPVGLCVSLKRTQSAAEALDLVERVVTLGHPRVVALSIDGNEASAGRTGPRFAAAFSNARAAGLRCCAHAGESSGPEGVLDAIEHLGAERIDHGVRCLEDRSLVHRLASDRIPLTVCPFSNVKLRVVDTLDQHPLADMLERGLCATVNSDDPAYFGGYVGENLAGVQQALRLDDDALVQLARNSFEASFLDDAARARHLAELNAAV
jgi:adenosine deaminase